MEEEPVRTVRFLRGKSLYHLGVAFSCGCGLPWCSRALRTGEMNSILTLRAGKPQPSPLEGFAPFRAQQAEVVFRQVARREWWLWFSAFFVTVLAGLALLLSSFPSLFQHNAHFYEPSAVQARWSVFCLLLLFNGWALYRQWCFRRERRQFAGLGAGAEAPAVLSSDSVGLDPVTGLYTRSFIEQQLGKEIARARRQNTSLSVATVHVEDLADINERFGASASELALKEIARRLKKACRGSDFAVRWANDDFLLVLPECGLGEVRLVLNRLGSLQVNCSGRDVTLTCTTGWVDYQPGDLPQDLLKRASQLLHLYEDAAKESFASNRAAR
jgi:diguanylate cyclase (GGDEF)-like protein